LSTLALENGDTLVGTDRHPIWVIEGEELYRRQAGDHGAGESLGATPGRWVAMGDLRPGDVVVAKEGRVTRVASIATADEVRPVYNIEVEGSHNYAVGQRGLLVHNAEYTQGATNAVRRGAAAPEAPNVRREPLGIPDRGTPSGTANIAGPDAPTRQTASPATAPADRVPRRPVPGSNGDPRVDPSGRNRTTGLPTRTSASVADEAALNNAIAEHRRALASGDAAARTAAGRQLGEIGGERYMQRQPNAALEYRQTTTGGQNDLDLVYRQGNRLVVVDTKGPNAALGARRLNPNNANSPFAMQGSKRYLELTIEAMRESGDAARVNIARELQRALDAGLLDYTAVSTRFSASGTTYFSVKRFILG